MKSVRISPPALLMTLVLLVNLCINEKTIASESQEIHNLRIS